MDTFFVRNFLLEKCDSYGWEHTWTYTYSQWKMSTKLSNCALKWWNIASDISYPFRKLIFQNLFMFRYIKEYNPDICDNIWIVHRTMFYILVSYFFGWQIVPGKSKIPSKIIWKVVIRGKVDILLLKVKVLAVVHVNQNVHIGWRLHVD